MYISQARRDAFNEKIDKINALLKSMVMNIENNPEDSDQYKIVVAGGESDWISRSEVEDRTDNMLKALQHGAIKL